MTKDPQPFLRWAGSKRKQVGRLSNFWKTSHDRYIEPFMGSACLFFAIRPQKAILSDINTDLVRTYLAVRDHPRAVFNRLSRIPLGKQSYCSLRKEKPGDLEEVQAAAHFIFLNRFCFNGLYRTNKAGQFNVPYAPSGTGQLPSAAELLAVSKLLRRCEIKQADFADILAKTTRGDFVYLDPPYAVGNRRVFRQYGPDSFGLEDLKRLAGGLLHLDSIGVSFVLSYACCPEAVEHFSRWPHRKIFVQRNIAGFATHRRRAGELLFSNCFPES